MKYLNNREKLIEKLDIAIKHGLCVDVRSFRKMILEPAEWPQEGDKYWYVDSDGLLMFDSFLGNVVHGEYVKFGNCFRTKKQAIKARDRIKSLLKEL